MKWKGKFLMRGPFYCGEIGPLKKWWCGNNKKWKALWEGPSIVNALIDETIQLGNSHNPTKIERKIPKPKSPMRLQQMEGIKLFGICTHQEWILSHVNNYLKETVLTADLKNLPLSLPHSLYILAFLVALFFISLHSYISSILLSSVWNYSAIAMSKEKWNFSLQSLSEKEQAMIKSLKEILNVEEEDIHYALKECNQDPNAAVDGGPSVRTR